MVRLRVAVAAIALIGPLADTAHGVCNYDSMAGETEKQAMLDTHNKMNLAKDVAGKCALLPRLIASNEQNKAKALSGCRGPQYMVDRIVRASDLDADNYRKVFREECNARVLAAIEKKKINLRKIAMVSFP